MNRGEIIIYQTPSGETQLDVRLENETVWLTQAQMVELFQTTKQNVGLHIRNIIKVHELDKNSTVKDFLTVQQEGKRNVQHTVVLYNLDMISKHINNTFKERKLDKNSVYAKFANTTKHVHSIFAGGMCKFCTLNIK
jgi:hypothetical protein